VADDYEITISECKLHFVLGRKLNADAWYSNLPPSKVKSINVKWGGVTQQSTKIQVVERKGVVVRKTSKTSHIINDDAKKTRERRNARRKSV